MSDRRTPPDDAIERARQLARDVALGPVTPEALEQAHQKLPPRRAECWRVFMEAFGARVREVEQRRNTWIAVLRGEISAAVADPKRLFLSPDKNEMRQFEAQREDRKSELDPIAVWRHKQGLLFRGERPFLHLHLLLCVDPAAWCAAIDALPAWDLMDGAFDYYTHLKNDPKLFEELLRIAPRVFDENGKWVSSRSVVALLLTHHALRIDSSEVWFRGVFRILLDRPDGKYVAFAFHGYLAHKELVADQRYWGQKNVPERMALNVLAELLGAKFSVKDAHDVWDATKAVAKAKHEQEKSRRVLKENDGVPRIADDRGEGARTLRGSGKGLLLLFGTAIMLGEKPAQAEVEAFWSWFEELLVGRDKSLSMARYEHTSPKVIPRFGALLGCLPDPYKTFREIYGKLECQRRRTTFSHHYEGDDDNVGSMLLLDIAPYAVLSWRNRDANADVEPFFWCGYDAARRLWLTTLQRFSEEQRKLVCYFFAFMPHIFGDDIEKALKKALRPIANDSWVVCSAGSLLLRNGITIERLIPLMRNAGVNLDIALRDAYQWATLTENQSIPRAHQSENEDFPAAFEELVRALGMALSIAEINERHKENATIEPTFTRLKRAFALGIAWGSRLLQRLDEERCTPQQLIPLDTRGAIWLLRVALPSDVAAQLGISPAIQILAAHGAVSEHELRTTVQDPEGNEIVEQDFLVVAGDQPELADRLPQLAGPWGRRIPWSIADDECAYVTDTLREHLQTFAHAPKG